MISHPAKTIVFIANRSIAVEGVEIGTPFSGDQPQIGQNSHMNDPRTGRQDGSYHEIVREPILFLAWLCEAKNNEYA